jgi:hypothetical protein
LISLLYLDSLWLAVTGKGTGYLPLITEEDGGGPATKQRRGSGAGAAAAIVDAEALLRARSLSSEMVFDPNAHKYCLIVLLASECHFLSPLVIL